MKIPLGAIAAFALLLASPADAIVGGAEPVVDGIGRSVVTIVGSRGTFCSGALIAPDLVLAAAHCLQPGATYKIVEYGADRQPQLRDASHVAFHPAFSLQAMMAHRATADVGLLQLEAAPKAKAVSAIGVPQTPLAAGNRFTIAGVGVTIRGEGKSGGIVRSANWSQPDGRGRCRSAWSIRPGRVCVPGSARAPGIPAGRLSRRSRASR